MSAPYAAQIAHEAAVREAQRTRARALIDTHATDHGDRTHLLGMLGLEEMEIAP